MNALSIRALSLASLLALAACSGGGGGGGGTTNPDPKGSISGTVSSAAGGVAGAGVAISGGASTTTNASGAFSFGNLNPGSYTLTVTPPAGFTLGTEVAAKTVAVVANQTASVGWTLQGSVVNPNPTTQEVHLGANAFIPDNVQISRGSTVRWINDNNIPHTITPTTAGQAGAWVSANVNTSGQTFEHTFNTAGTFNYHCNVHAGMSAVVRVQ